MRGAGVGMPNISVEKFLECLERSELVEKDRLTPALAALRESDSGAFDDVERLAAKLVEDKLITQWQGDALLKGKSSGFNLGQYKLLGVLGTGGMSSVYLGEHRMMRCLRAIKVLPVSRVNDSSYLERFRQEAMAAARLNHPNIVQAYDISQHGKYHYIVMEYVEGRDLQNLVKEQGPLDYDQAANYIRQAAEGLAYAHEAGLIHRDIKPANLLVDGRGIVKLLDLGLARFVDDKAPSLTIAHDENVLGTADYLAPEQAVDSHGVDSRADIYSLGCTLYYLLTGHPPFPTGTLPQRIHAHQTKLPASIYEDRHDAPQALVDVCIRMMAKSPAARYQTAKEVAEVLTAWLAGRSNPLLGGASGSGRPQGGGRPLPPPRRSGTAVAPPPRREKPSKTNDTLADTDSETFKGVPGRPQPGNIAARASDSRNGGSGPLSSGKLGKSLSEKAGESGRAGTRSGNLPTARALDAPEDPDDVNSVLFGPTGGGSIKITSRRGPESRRGPMSPAHLPRWVIYLIAAFLVLSLAVFIILVVIDASGTTPTPTPPASTSTTHSAPTPSAKPSGKSS
jgi:serine/threonine protein kinase